MKPFVTLKDLLSFKIGTPRPMFPSVYCDTLQCTIGTLAFSQWHWVHKLPPVPSYFVGKGVFVLRTKTWVSVVPEPDPWSGLAPYLIVHTDGEEEDPRHPEIENKINCFMEVSPDPQWGGGITLTRGETRLLNTTKMSNVESLANTDDKERLQKWERRCSADYNG